MRWASLLLLLSLACAKETPPAMDPLPPEMMPPEMMPPEVMEPPPWAPPEVWGAAPAMDLSDDPDVVEIELAAAPQAMTLFDGMSLDMYAYGGSFPGPMIQAKVGDRVIVHFTNELPEPTTIHWHGLRISDQMDGSPRIQDPVRPGASFTYDFVVKEAGSFWYHPHVRANEQIEKGLYGALIVHEPEDPTFDRERYLVLDDILVSDTGLYPFLQSHPEIMHGRNGNVLLTNGKAELPAETARPGSIERWRIVNTANARTMELTITGAPLKVIASDGGRLRAPEIMYRLIVAVGQRYDLEVQVPESGRVELASNVLAVNDRNELEEIAIPIFALDVMGEPVAARELAWPALPEEPSRSIDAEVTIEFDAVQGGEHGLQWTLNGMAHAEDPLFTFTEGQTVLMHLVNNQGPEHPFHLHGQFFDVVDDLPGGLKDTVLLPGLTSLDIIAYFDNPGRWMSHCHILEHQELGMMGEIVVEPR